MLNPIPAPLSCNESAQPLVQTDADGIDSMFNRFAAELVAIFGAPSGVRFRAHSRTLRPDCALRPS
jgi:hypothetical protein